MEIKQHEKVNTSLCLKLCISFNSHIINHSYSTTYIKYVKLWGNKKVQLFISFTVTDLKSRAHVHIHSKIETLHLLCCLTGENKPSSCQLCNSLVLLVQYNLLTLRLAAG